MVSAGTSIIHSRTQASMKLILVPTSHKYQRGFGWEKRGTKEASSTHSVSLLLMSESGFFWALLPELVLSGPWIGPITTHSPHCKYSWNSCWMNIGVPEQTLPISFWLWTLFVLGKKVYVTSLVGLGVLRVCHGYGKLCSKPKSGHWSMTVPLWSIPEDRWREILPGQNREQCTWLCILPTRRNDKVRVYTNSWAVEHGLAGWSGIWKEHYWKIGAKEVWGRGILIDFSEWLKNVKRFVSHVNAHQRITSAEGDFK